MKYEEDFGIKIKQQLRDNEARFVIIIKIIIIIIIVIVVVVVIIKATTRK